jgi:hypothetical protein
MAGQVLKIGKDLLGLDFEYRGNCELIGKGIINIQPPLRAMDWFRRRLHDNDGSVYYMYETLQNEPEQITLASHAKLTEQKPYYMYESISGWHHEHSTQEDYDERRKRIKRSGANLKLAKYRGIESGAFGSQTMHVDVANRSFGKEYYGYAANFPIDKTLYKTDLFDAPAHLEHDGIETKYNKHEKIDRRVTLDPKIVNKEQLPDEYYASTNLLARNSEAYGILKNYNECVYKKTGVIRAFPGVFDTLEHDIVLNGDFELNPGKVIELRYPRAADPSRGGDELLDTFMSGNYLVVSTVHHFIEDKYTMDVRVRRDSFTPPGAEVQEAKRKKNDRKG